MSQDQADQDSATDEVVGSSEVAALYASASRIFVRYKEQWDTSKQILGAELELSLRALWLILVFVIIFFSVMVVTWLGVNVLLGYGLLTIATPIWGIALSILAFNMLTIWVLTRTIRGLVKAIGFSRSLALFSSAKAASSEVSDAAVPTRSGGM